MSKIIKEDKKMKGWVLLQKLLNLAKPYRKWFLFATFLAIITSALSPIRPYLIQQIIDENITLNHGKGIEIMMLWLIGLLLIESILRYFFMYITALLGQTVIKDLRLSVFAKISNFDLHFFDTTPIGTSTTRTINDVETINDIYSENFFTIISDLLTIFFVLGLMFYKNWQLTLISLIPFPFLLWATYNFKENVQKTFGKVREKIAEMNAFLQEHISGVKITQIFNAEKKESLKFDSINAQHRDAQIESIWHYSVFFPAMELILAISIGFMVCFASYKCLGQHNYKVGEVTAFFLYLNMIFRPMRFLADKFNTLQMGFIASERVFKILETQNSMEDKGNLSPVKINGEIEFKNVHFSYIPGQNVLKGINFSIKKGETLAIVGATGSGKTSIISTLCRFYEIQEGEISIDGIPISQFTLSALRSHIGLVLQDVYLFSGTIFDNIAMHNPEITLEKVIAAAKELEIHDFIMSLPNNYNYDVKERGATLSLGQRQLISFARAYLLNPSILILDEATSSVDNLTEKIIQNTISKMILGRTTIVIAHRLSTIVNSTKILVLNKGEVKGLGTHSELIKSNEIYKKYFSF